MAHHATPGIVAGAATSWKTTIAGVLTVCVLMMSGCTEGGPIDSILRPSVTATRKAIDEERKTLADRERQLETRIVAAREDERRTIAEIAAERVEVQRDYDKDAADYRADMALIDSRHQAATTAAEFRVERLASDAERLGARRAQSEAEWERRMQAAESSDDLLYGLAGVGLTFVPGGLGIAALVKRLRRRSIEIIEARQAGEQIGHDRGVAAVRDSVAAGRAADPQFDAMFENDTAASRVMRAVVEKLPEVEAVLKAGDAHKPQSATS